MAAAPTGAYFHPGRAANASTENTRESRDIPYIHVAEKPPFNVGSKRFNKHDAGMPTNSPAYHAAYADTTAAPPRWDVKGWPSMDDPIKRGRGTSGGKVFSSMAKPSGLPSSGATLQPMFATYPNEARLQELLSLQQRRTQGVPPPGTYEVPSSLGTSRISFRRPACRELDGPFPAQTESTRVKEIQAMHNLTSGGPVGPGEYETAGKDLVSSLRHAPAHRIGLGAREGRTKQTMSLSISRSLQHGIDWHVPVVVQVAIPAAPQKITASSSAQGAQGELGNSAANTLQSQASQAAAYMHRQQQPPKYLEPSTSHQAQTGLPPPPPVHVSRTSNRHLVHQPGAWNWESLAFNYRTAWTTAHGGSYLHGDKQHLRRTKTEHKQESSEPGLESLLQFGPESSIQLSSLPITNNNIFPIAEEQSEAYHDIGSAPPSAGDQGVGMRGAAAWFASPEELQGSASARSPNSPTRGLASAQDLARHSMAMQAASAVQQVNLRRTQWEAKSGDSRASGSSGVPSSSTVSAGSWPAAVAVK